MRPHEGAFCTTTFRSAGLWLASSAALVALALMIAALAPGANAFAHALVYAALGGACMFTYRRCRTAHCAITGPGFLVIAAALALHAAGVWRVSATFIWSAFAVVLGAGLVLEIATGRRHKRPDAAQSPR